MGRVQDKVAIITGGGSGFGEQACLLFAQEGAKIVCVDLREDRTSRVVEEIRKQGGEAIAVTADVSSDEDWQRVVKTCIDTYGKLDILFNNAGILLTSNYHDIPRTDLKVLDKTYEVNIKGVWLGIRNCAAELVKTRGAIVNTASEVVATGGMGSAAYDLSKHAVVGMTRDAACELGIWGVRVNAISPYGSPTNIGGEGLGTIPESLKILAKSGNPLFTDINPKEIAYAALFLSSGECKQISGQNLFVDGGASIMGQPYNLRDYIAENPYEGGVSTWNFDNIPEGF